MGTVHCAALGQSGWVVAEPCTSHPQINPHAGARGQFAPPVSGCSYQPRRTQVPQPTQLDRSHPTQHAQCVPIKVIAWIISTDLTQFIRYTYLESGDF